MFTFFSIWRKLDFSTRLSVSLTLVINIARTRDQRTNEILKIFDLIEPVGSWIPGPDFWTEILGTDKAKIYHEKRLHGPNQKKVRPKNEDHHFIPAARITFNPDWAQKISKFQKNFHLQKIVFEHFFCQIGRFGVWHVDCRFQNL